MRHVRMLVLCLVAMFAMSAMTYAVASPALASCNEECQKEKEKAKQEKEEQKAKEKAEAKKQKEKEKLERESAEEKYSADTWQQFKHCPIHNEAFMAKGASADCAFGRTTGGSEGGFFTLGGVTVKLSKPITLQGGIEARSKKERQELSATQTHCEENPEYSPECKVAAESPGGTEKYFLYKKNDFKLYPAEGAETLEAPELKVQQGLNLVTSAIQERQAWPEALKASFKEAQKHNEANLYVKIEAAGTSAYEYFGALNTGRLLAEEGPTFILPLKVRMINPWLEKLGGGPCTVGSDEHPVIQNLTTESPGRAGEFHFNENFTEDGFEHTRLVDVNWPVPTEADAKGCGGEYESYVDGAINEVLELPTRHGITVLQGNLYTATASFAKRAIEEGQP